MSRPAGDLATVEARIDAIVERMKARRRELCEGERRRRAAQDAALEAKRLERVCRERDAREEERRVLKIERKIERKIKRDAERARRAEAKQSETAEEALDRQLAKISRWRVLLEAKRAEIARLNLEGWSDDGIARVLGVHLAIVDKALSLPKRKS